jgi:hypothetical protein
MNSSRYSELGAVLAVAVLLAVAAVPAAAVTIEGDAPTTAQVGEQQQTTFTITDPFSEYEEWTLRAETDLTEVTWQVTTFDNAGNQVNEETLTGQTMEYQLAASSGVVRAEVRLVGTTPQATAFDWSYEPPQQITYAEFIETQQGGSSEVLETMNTRPYTDASQEARDAIAAAQQAVDDAQGSGAGVSGAQSDVDDAVEFFNSGQFDSAVENAEEAEQTANNAASSAQQTDTLLMIGAGVVVLALLGGGIYWYLQQRDSGYDKLG